MTGGSGRRQHVPARLRTARLRPPASPEERQDRTTPISSPTPAERRAAASSCAWCGNLIQPKARGRIPTWCSSACRRRAWDQKLATTSGRSAVEVVERLVEVPVPATPGRRDWPRLLGELTRQLEDGRIYDRDLAALAEALLAATDACGRRGARLLDIRPDRR